MRLKSILTLMVAAGSLFMAVSARAQTLHLVAIANTPTGATGTYNVTITKVSPTVFSVATTGVADGTAGKHNADQISFTFLGDTIAAGSTGQTSAPWTVGVPGSDTVHYSSPGPAFDVLAMGGNTFTGTVDLASAFSTGTIKVAIQDGGQQWFTSAQLTPEAGSLALIVPALLPLLLLGRRRRGRISTLAT